MVGFLLARYVIAHALYAGMLGILNKNENHRHPFFCALFPIILLGGFVTFFDCAYLQGKLQLAGFRLVTYVIAHACYAGMQTTSNENQFLTKEFFFIFPIILLVGW